MASPPATEAGTMTIRILILDTETNGLPKNKYAPVSEFGLYPAILQLSWAIFTISEKHMHPGARKDIGLALDPSVPWDTGAAAIHGLTEIEARQGTGTYAATALLELGEMMRSVDCVVAHNLAFDKPVLRAAAYAEASRAQSVTDAEKLRNLWPTEAKEFCTMIATRGLVKIPATATQAQYAALGPYKSPKLNELYAWIYGHAYDISGASLHNSQSDVHCLAICIGGLLKQGHIRADLVKRSLVLSLPGNA